MSARRSAAPASADPTTDPNATPLQEPEQAPGPEIAHPRTVSEFVDGVAPALPPIETLAAAAEPLSPTQSDEVTDA